MVRLQFRTYEGPCCAVGLGRENHDVGDQLNFHAGSTEFIEAHSTDATEIQRCMTRAHGKAFKQVGCTVSAARC